MKHICLGFLVILIILSCSRKPDKLDNKPIKAIQKPVIILITVDCLRYKNMYGLGYEKKTCPYLSNFIKNGVTFTHAYSAGAWTIPSLISMLTSLPSTSHGVWTRGYALNPSILTLPKVLERNGYYCPNICYLTSDPMFANLGFSDFLGRELYLAKGDTALLDMLEDVKRGKKPAFLYYHNRSLHLPYLPEEKYLKPFLPSYNLSKKEKETLDQVKSQAILDKGSIDINDRLREVIIAYYDGMLSQIDESLFKPLWESIQGDAIRNNVIVIISADHGEELFEHGWIGHASTSLSGQVYEEVIRVPFIIYAPQRLPSGKSIDYPVSTLDIMPTILELVGIDSPKGIMGMSLKSLKRRSGRSVICETTLGGYRTEGEMKGDRFHVLIKNNIKLVKESKQEKDIFLLYDITKDPIESNDIKDMQPILFDDMKKELSRFLGDAAILARKPVEEERPRATLDGNITITSPVDKAILKFEQEKGKVSIRWKGGSGRVLIEYDIADKHKKLTGYFPVEGFSREFGPLSEKSWKMLESFNPFKLRLIDKEKGSATLWITIYFKVK